MIASHEEYPIERLKLDPGGKWLGSVSHDDCVKLTNVEDLFEDSEGEQTTMGDEDEIGEDSVSKNESMMEDEGVLGTRQESSDDSMAEPKNMKKKKSRRKAGLRDMGRNQSREDPQSGFFADL